MASPVADPTTLQLVCVSGEVPVTTFPLNLHAQLVVLDHFIGLPPGVVTSGRLTVLVPVITFVVPEKLTL